MIDNQLIQMLDNPNPKVRADAVKQLAKTKSQEAVQYLAAVYKTDDDPEIRELARKAGLYIKKKMTEEKWTGGDLEEDEEEVEEVRQKPMKVDVSPRNIESAKGYMETAMNLHVAGEDEKATKMLEKAFKANPNLRFDNYSVGLASTILGIEGEGAITALLGEDEMDAGNKSKRKRKNSEANPDEVSTETVIIDLLIYGIVIFALILISMLILMSLLGNSLDTALQVNPQLLSQIGDGSEAYYAAQLLSSFEQSGFQIYLIIAAVGSIYSIIVLLLQYASMHIAAQFMLGGDGSFKVLVHKASNALTFFTVAYVLMIFAIAYFYMSATVSGNLGGLGTAYSIYGIMGLASLVYLVWFIQMLGKVYQFGSGKGCVTIILGGIILNIITAIISGGLWAVFYPVLKGMMGGMPTGM